MGGQNVKNQILAALLHCGRNTANGNKSEVRVNKLKGREAAFMILLTGIVTPIFYFILDAFNTANIILSTLSVTTSFLAVYLTCRRSEYFALAYAANNAVLIILWIMAAFESSMYLSVAVCFAAFLINDIYGYVSWQKMYLRQNGLIPSR
ncbi:MAG: nicotinamide mononucleotide transporter family protein [Oscillospiraceae bacterium]|nr:nicotinamide mononucleotide transporter family protein [Oscillospiraceae bacterium]